jgi:predicted permease
MLSDLQYRLRGLFRRRAVERELQDELQFHLDHQIAKLIAAGIPREQAERQARLIVGSAEPLKEACRDVRGTTTVDGVVQDVRYALRQLRKAPGFAAVVVASLALGIGANTAIFSLIDALLFRSLPVEDPSGLYFVTSAATDGGSRRLGYAEFRRLQTADPVFAGVAAFGTTRVNVSIDGSIEPAAEGHLVSGNYFPLLGVPAIVGRTIAPEDDVNPNAHPVAVLGYGYWKRRFALDPAVVGRTISIAGAPFTVIGVAAPEFFGLEVGRAAEIFVPVVMQPTVMPASENWLEPSILRSFWLQPIVRLARDVTPRQAAGALAGQAILDQLFTKPSRRGEKPQLIPERLEISSAATGLSALRQQFSQPLFILMLVVGVVLLIACANVASLVLARGAARVSEFSMRLALGAGRGRLIRQLLVENVLLAFIGGGACGVVLARWATGVLVTFMSAGRTPIALDVDPDARILAFTAGVSIVTGILCGVLPALEAGRIDLIAGLRRHGTAGMGGGHWTGPGRALVVAQVTLCLVLLFGAGLFLRSLQLVDAHDAGFDRTRVLVARVEPRGSDQRSIPGTSERLNRLYRDLLQRVESIPGVRSASLAHYGPTTPITYGGPLSIGSGEERQVSQMMVYPKYFETMGIAFTAGRDFEERDLDADAPYVGIVNEAFVRQVMSGENPVGRQLPVERGGQLRLIIGVVKDTKYASARGETPPVLYQPFLQTNTGRGQMTLHVRTHEDAQAVMTRVREAIQSIDRQMPLFPILTLAAQVDALLGRERLVAALTSLFSAVALLLAAVGLYGLMAFAVVQRTTEMGIRMALGAARRMVLGLMMREALSLVAIGLAIGVPAALVTGRLARNQISGLLFGVTATDPGTMLGAAAVLVLVGAAAAYLPAARASRVDPMVSLRSD